MQFSGFLELKYPKFILFFVQTAQNGKFLEASVNYFAWEEAFDVEDDVVGFEL